MNQTKSINQSHDWSILHQNGGHVAECLVAYDDAAYAAYEDLESCRDAKRARLTNEQQVPNMGLSARPPSESLPRSHHGNFHWEAQLLSLSQKYAFTTGRAGMFP